MRIALAAATVVFAASSVQATDIREFSVSTLERLGGELSRRDEIAARASDLLLKERPVARSMKMRGWITELKSSGDAVHFIAETPSGPTLAYTVTFSRSGKPEVQDMRGEPLPENVAVRYKARATATAALQGKLFDAPYNFEILDDPDGSGFLVYALAATKKSDEVVLAGHFRVTVSADGTRAERVDALSKSLLLSGPRQANTAALFLIQLVSNTPVETLIYTANLAKTDIYVGTPDRKMWVVGKGKMRVEASKTGNKSSAPAPRAAPPR